MNLLDELSRSVLAEIHFPFVLLFLSQRTSVHWRLYLKMVTDCEASLFNF